MNSMGKILMTYFNTLAVSNRVEHQAAARPCDALPTALLAH